MAAVVTLIPVTAECGCPAKFNGAHDTSLARRHSGTMDFPVLRSVAAEDVRYLERGSGHDCRLRLHLNRQQVQGTAGSADSAGRDVRVARRGLQAAMA